MKLRTRTRRSEGSGGGIEVRQRTAEEAAALFDIFDKYRPERAPDPRAKQDAIRAGPLLGFGRDVHGLRGLGVPLLNEAQVETEPTRRVIGKEVPR